MRTNEQNRIIIIIITIIKKQTKKQKKSKGKLKIVLIQYDLIKEIKL